MKMDIVGVDDVHLLDPELLHLPCLSPSPPLKASSRHIADELFSHWLSLPETASLVKCLIDEAKSGTPTKSYPTIINVPGAATALPSVSPLSSEIS